ncbi:chromate transporter [Paenibacillus albidus]|uniref:chromate transporter n=1 Tax=Paenibacillus albidus TaxID=2041023 RepID=UPI001BEAE41A|nr:chromate transporter [Paenibacillus albidus]MBT2290962.1 chromate transporter [Paenibacillus albidus]
MLWHLFIVFLKVGCISFGGGYAVMTLIQREVASKGWVDSGQFEEIVALAGMAPGSIATNTATLIGYTTSGIAGAVASTIGIILPSLIIVIVIAAFFLKLQGNAWVKSSFYGLRPVITGLIIYAAYHFGLGGRTEALLSWTMLGTVVICVGCLIAVTHFKIHPFTVILLSAVAGIIIF